MIFGMPNSVSSISDLAKEIAQKTEATILGQLNDFISRGLITVEYGEFCMFQDPTIARLNVSQQITLRLKDKEYIESLERQVLELKTLVDTLRNKGAK